MPTEEQTYRDGIGKRFDTQDVMLSKIFEQARHTNGRVTRLEKVVLVVGTATTIIILLEFPKLAPLLHLV